MNKLIFLIVLALLTGACSSPKKPTETSTPVPTSTPTALATAISASPTPSPTPTASVTPTRPRGLPPTPTIFPVVTPDSGPESYQLAEWSELAALELVAIGETYGQDLRFALEDWWPHKPWFYGGSLIELAAREALLRFPNISDRERLEWRIALEEATQSWRHGPPDARILTLLETGLNDGRYSLGSLDTFLNPLGFEVWKSLSAPNLFGDGQVAQIIVVTTIEVYADGMIIALRQDVEGRYNLVRVGSYWMFDIGGYLDVFLEELTADAVPEIITVPHAHSGSMCGTSVDIWQWQEDHFADLTGTGGIRVTYVTDCRAMWRIIPPDGDGFPTIQTVDHVIGYESATTITRTFRWNGVVYEMSDFVAVPPSEQLKDDFLVEAVERWRDERPLTDAASDESDVISTTRQITIQAESLLLTEGDPVQAIPLLTDILAEPEQEHEDFSRPRLYYLLGLAHELVGDDQNAVMAYWQLWRDYPDSPYVLLVRAKLE